MLQACLIHTKESIRHVCDKSYHKSKKIYLLGGAWKIVELCINSMQGALKRKRINYVVI